MDWIAGLNVHQLPHVLIDQVRGGFLGSMIPLLFVVAGVLAKGWVIQ